MKQMSGTENEMCLDSIVELVHFIITYLQKSILVKCSLNCFNPGFQMNSINFIYPHCSQNMETICPFRIIH